MKELYIQGSQVGERFHAHGDGQRVIAGTIEEAADIITRGDVPIVTSGFDTWRVTSYLLTPQPTTQKKIRTSQFLHFFDY